MQAKSVHLIGIGGAGLSAIAAVLLEQGYTVSGSDLRPSPATERLAQRGASVHIGHRASNVGSADAVIVSSAVPEGNPEVEEARRRGIPVIKRAEWLGRMMAGQRGVAVSGTHGKTTTTAMIALILREAGLDPTFIVGGDIPQLGTNAAAGKGDVFVVEADEYDRTFLGLRPEIAVITVLEWDHPDCYPTPDSMRQAFREFVDRVPHHGLVIACGDETGVKELLEGWKIGRLEDWKSGRTEADEPFANHPNFQPPNLPSFHPSNLPSILYYGLDAHNAYRAVDLRPNARGGYDFAVVQAVDAHAAGAGQELGRRLGEISLAVPGRHNVLNALAALAVAERLGVPFVQAAITLGSFAGVGRRFEVKGQAEGVLVVDDYAHHPTEIRATLAAARVRYPDRTIWAVFQPHTYSRTRALLDDFAAAFTDADHVIVLDIFAARETDDGTVHSRDIVARMHHPDARHIGSFGEAVDFVAGQLHPGDVLITLGAGDGYRVGEMVLEQVGGAAAGSGSSSPPGVEALAGALQARFGGRLRRDEPLAAHTTLRVGGPADLWLSVATLDELIETVALARQHAVPAFTLGSGANLLVGDRGIRGLVVQNRCQQVTFPPADAVGEAGDRVRVVVESGAILPSLAHRLAQQGLSGLEWAVGVPGTLGGAVVNNAGAYGSSIADCLVRAELYSPARGQRAWQPVDWFEYDYRASRLKRSGAAQAAGDGEQFVVLRAELALARRPSAEIESQMALYSERRRASQPPGASIGSMFKNPPGDYAGRLIEAAGLKGTQIGGAQISPVHANFFVNRGEASAMDLDALIDLARQSVKARFNVDLELEIEKAGDWGDA